MLRYFRDEATNATRSHQIWLILIGMARNRQTTTYGQLAGILGFKGAGTLNRPLGHIMHYCLEHRLPPLTVLVVNQETGLPGEGLIEADLNADREAVFNFDWYALFPPAPDALQAAYKRGSTAQGG